MYYISESRALNLSFGNGASWYPPSDLDLPKYFTAENTRSLSVTSRPSNFTSSALLFYEDPNGKVSALLQRSLGNGTVRYINITSQKSNSLPNQFHNPTGSNFSYTLYESNINATFSAPFTSRLNLSISDPVGAVFYSPPNASPESDAAHGCWVPTFFYMDPRDPSGPLGFSGILWASTYHYSHVDGHRQIRRPKLRGRSPSIAPAVRYCILWHEECHVDKWHTTSISRARRLQYAKDRISVRTACQCNFD